MPSEQSRRKTTAVSLDDRTIDLVDAFAEAQGLSLDEALALLVARGVQAMRKTTRQRMKGRR